MPSIRLLSDIRRVVSFQGVHSRPNSAPVHFSRGRKDAPSARGHFETQPDIFSMAHDQAPTSYPVHGPDLPNHVGTDADISCLMPSLDLNQPPPVFDRRKAAAPPGGYLDQDVHPPISKTRGQPGFIAPPFAHIPYPDTPLFPVEHPVTEPSSLSPPPYGKPRVPAGFPLPIYPGVPYPLAPPPRVVPDSSPFSNVHDPPVLDPTSFVLPLAYEYGALERPDGFVPPPSAPEARIPPAATSRGAHSL